MRSDGLTVRDRKGKLSWNSTFGLFGDEPPADVDSICNAMAMYLNARHARNFFNCRASLKYARKTVCKQIAKFSTVEIGAELVTAWT